MRLTTNFYLNLATIHSRAKLRAQENPICFFSLFLSKHTPVSVHLVITTTLKFYLSLNFNTNRNILVLRSPSTSPGSVSIPRGWFLPHWLVYCSSSSVVYQTYGLYRCKRFVMPVNPSSCVRYAIKYVHTISYTTLHACTQKWHTVLIMMVRPSLLCSSPSGLCFIWSTGNDNSGAWVTSGILWDSTRKRLIFFIH